MEIPDAWAPLLVSAVRDAVSYQEGLLKSETIRNRSDYEEHRFLQERPLGIPLSLVSCYHCYMTKQSRVSYRGLSPRKFMPMQSVHEASQIRASYSPLLATLNLERKIGKIFFIGILVFLSGCSYMGWFNGDQQVVFDKPKIHLFLYNDYKSRTEELIKALVDRGYEVVLRSREPPRKGASSFIIHSPGVNPGHFHEVDILIDILMAQGITDIGKYQYSLGNHSYTFENIGVYLM